MATIGQIPKRALPSRRDLRHVAARGRDTVLSVPVALALQRDPLHFVTHLAARGDYVPFQLLGSNALFVNAPMAVRHVLQDNHRNYTKDTPFQAAVSVIGGQGLFTSDGELWRRQRRAVRPIFRYDHIASLSPLIVEATLTMLDRWERELDETRTFDLSQELLALMLTVSGSALFGARLADDAIAVSGALEEINAILGDFARLPFPPLTWPVPRTRRLRAAMQILDSTVYRLIRDHRAHPEQHSGDLLALLIAASNPHSPDADRQLRDEVITLLLGAQETSATTLAWAWFLLGRDELSDHRVHSEVCAALGDALPDAGSVVRLPFTRCILEETMRLYPSLWLLMRRAADEDVIGDHHVDRGTLIIISPFTLHRHPAFWENATDFEPDRFRRSGGAAGHDRWVHIPFGAGPRACIGARLAMLQMQLIVAVVQRRYRLVLDMPQDPKPQPHVTLRPHGGVWVRALRREGAP